MTKSELKNDIALIKRDIKYIMVTGSIFGSMIPIGFAILGLMIKLS